MSLSSSFLGLNFQTWKRQRWTFLAAEINLLGFDAEWLDRLFRSYPWTEQSFQALVDAVDCEDVSPTTQTVEDTVEPAWSFQRCLGPSDKVGTLSASVLSSLVEPAHLQEWCSQRLFDAQSEPVVEKGDLTCQVSMTD